MKKIPFLLLFPLALFAKEEKKQPQKKPKSKQVVAAHKEQENNEMMIIDPKNRASDIQEAFQYLTKHGSGKKPIVHLKDGSTLTNILDIQVLKGGTMVIFKLSTTMGTEYLVTNIESIENLSL